MATPLSQVAHSARAESGHTSGLSFARVLAHLLAVCREVLLGVLKEKHKDDFLYSATGVAMQGTGVTTDGKYIRIVNKPGWRNNSRGHPEWLEKPSSAIFEYTDGFHGKMGDIIENHSIAVDIKIIPKKGKVEIDGVGKRVADDTGGAIKLYHIDNFLESGKAVVKAWLKGGVNGTKRRVKYLGSSE